MSVWPISADPCPGLHSPQGDLISVRVSLDPRALEDLLEALAGLPFPVNPEIRHAIPLTVVEFPAYASHLDEVRKVVDAVGIGDCRVEAANMLAAIR